MGHRSVYILWKIDNKLFFGAFTSKSRPIRPEMRNCCLLVQTQNCEVNFISALYISNQIRCSDSTLNNKNERNLLIFGRRSFVKVAEVVGPGLVGRGTHFEARVPYHDVQAGQAWKHVVKKKVDKLISITNREIPTFEQYLSNCRCKCKCCF